MINNGDGDGDGFQIIEERTVQEIYSDSVRFHLTVYGVTLEFGQMPKPKPTGKGLAPHIPKIRVSMSPQHAKVMALLFARNMREYEEKVGKINLPDEMLRELNLEDQW